MGAAYQAAPTNIERRAKILNVQNEIISHTREKREKYN